MVDLSINNQVWTLLALVLAELARQLNRDIKLMTLHVLVDDGQVLRVPSSKT